MILIKTFCGACATVVCRKGVCPLWTKKEGFFFRCGCPDLKTLIAIESTSVYNKTCKNVWR